MAKARMLSRAIALDKQLNGLSLKCQLIYTWCIPFLDDYGLINNDPGVLKYLIFPRNNHISEDDIAEFIREAKNADCSKLMCGKEEKGLIEELEDCLYFKGFQNHNRLTDYKRSQSEFKKNRYNKPKNNIPQETPEIPENSRSSPSKDRLSKDRLSKVNSKYNSRFAPPTSQEVKKYCDERTNQIDPQKFIDFYESKGWMVGKNKMKNWQACIRTWEKTTPKKEEEWNEKKEAERKIYEEKFYKEHGYYPLK